jgi:ATP-dependent exoDNAse (exonuclease V) beta subunit
MMIPDNKERTQALDPARSFIVEAPAGSGKTELLIRRYLKLLATVERPEDILAITFTRKAAGEMHSRVVDALSFAAKGVEPKESYKLETYELSIEALARDGEKGWGLLENPSRLRVQTIDSLSARIIAGMPVLTGLGGRANIVEEPDEIYEEAARRTIEKVEEDTRDGECVREALSHLDNFSPNLRARLVAMLKKRDQWLSLIGVGPAPLEDSSLKEKLEAPVKAIVEELLHSLPPLFDASISAQLFKSARFAANVLLREGSTSPLTKLADLDALPGTRAQNIERWRLVGSFLMTKEGEWRKGTGVNKRIGFPKEKEYEDEKNDFKALLDDLSTRDELKEAFSRLTVLPNVRYDEEEWSILLALLHLLPVAAAELDLIFATDGLLDFQALTILASRALGTEENPEELLLAMDTRLKHLLVDEFQDTSKSHFRLIETLVSGFVPGDGRTLFIVGDPMQSIYLFRDADVGLFLKAAAQGVAGVELKRLRLTSNFRSLPAIVDWVNETFAPAFPGVEDISSGAVRYTNSEAVQEGINETSLAMSIYSSRDDLLEAADIADRVETLQRVGGIDESIAILVRSRTHLARIIEEFKERGIDFRTTKLDPLIESAVVQDLMSLIRALEHPFDRVAWLAILRAPWCGLSLGDIHRLTCSAPIAPIYPLMNDDELRAKLSRDGQERLTRFNEKISRALELRGRVSYRALIESLWIDIGGPACIEEAGEMENAEAVFDSLDQFLLSGVPFSVSALEARALKLFATHNGMTETPVEIMTIHNAKGLEFDHVILPGLGKSAGSDRLELLTWIEKDGEMLLAPIEGSEIREASSLYSYIRLLKAEKLKLELTRLLYVAATRARVSLSVYGHATGTGEDGEGQEAKVKVDSRSLLAAIESSLDSTFIKDIAESGASVIEESSAVINLKRLDASWKPPLPAPALTCGEFTGIPDLAESGEARPSFDWATEERKHIGTVLHRYFCRVVREGLDVWELGRAEKESENMQMMLKGLGLSIEKARAGAKESVKILTEALKDKDGQFVLGTHKESEVEYRLTGVLDGQVKDVRIDRTFVDSDNVRWIVDYKTGSHKGDIEEFLENEKTRYAPQLKKYKALLASLDASREVKCALYYPALARLVEL